MNIRHIAGTGLLAAGALLAASSIGGHGPHAEASTETPKPTGIFNVVCDYAKSASIDPIAMYGHVGMSMKHDFYGATRISATSKGPDLLGTGTTCTSAKDPSAYWTPSLYQDGKQIKPTKTKIYYQSTPDTARKVKPFPVGLQILVGDKAGTAPHDDWTVWFSCAKGDKSIGGITRKVPESCPSGTEFQINFRFPECWDGRTLAGKSQRNVAYRTAEGCPKGYPVEIPRMVTHVHYPINGPLGQLTLSSAPGKVSGIYTAHMDFINAWDPKTLKERVKTCLHAQVKCGTLRD